MSLPMDKDRFFILASRPGSFSLFFGDVPLLGRWWIGHTVKDFRFVQPGKSGQQAKSRRR
jgi:hypothetical protein